MNIVIKKDGLQRKAKKNIFTVKKWTLKQQALFFKVLSDLLISGFSLQQALESMENLLPKSKLQIRSIIENLSLGINFSKCLKSHVSKSIYYQVIIAEQHGKLEESTYQLGKLLDKRVEQQAKLQSLLVYPIILIIMLTLIVCAVQLWLKPTLSQFDTFGGYNFPFEKIIKWIGLFILGIFFIYCMKVFYWWKKQPTLSKHHWYSQLPILGNVYCQYSYYYLAFNLGMLLKSGLDFQQICDFLNKFDEQSLLYQLGSQLQEWLLNGEELNEFVKRYPFIPQELGLFFSKGQTKKELSVELLCYSEMKYQELLRLLDRMLNFVQPLLFIVIALIIVGTYLAILLPMYQSIGNMY